MTEPLLSVRTAEHCFDAQFHPSEPLLAAATITGDVELHRYDVANASEELVRSVRNHEESCRSAHFVGGSDGIRLLSISADASAVLADIESGKQLWQAKLGAAGNALLPLGPKQFAVGDDDGGVAIYDVRKKKPTAQFAENEDYISDMALGADQQSICATSGDGTLAVYDRRKTGTKGLIAMSDFQEDEYLSVAIVKQGTKVVCGSQTGVLSIFSWGDFGDLKDRIKGHPMSVDTLVPLTDLGVLTGSSDGTIRVVSVYGSEQGNCIVGTLGDHGEYPIEHLALSPDKDLLASASHGRPAIRIWSTEAAHRLLSGKGVEGGGEAAESKENAGDGADGSSDDSDEPKPRRKKKRRKGAPVNKAQSSAKNFFAGL